MIDAVLVSVIDVGRRPPRTGRRCTPPRPTGTPDRRPTAYVYVVLAPERIQAWREANEIAGRTLMRHGKWLV